MCRDVRLADFLTGRFDALRVMAMTITLMMVLAMAEAILVV
jgi:hypothetical protein